MRSIYLVVLSLVCLDVAGQHCAIAFPGAEGFGKFTTGGRGGKIVIVSSLADDGPRTLRKAVQMKGPRIIVFSVSGNIELASPLTINAGDVTIAGQSAPGDGICIKNYPVAVSADNVIIRFLRFRLGDEKAFEGDAISANKRSDRVIIDHCSMSWATDECASFYRNKNFTLQWCIISESLNHSVHQKGDHGYGGIWGGEGASFHHNLLASHTSRLPRFSGSSTTPNSAAELVDFRNNVIYNWMHNNTYGGEKGKYNVVGNFYKPGPATQKSRVNQLLDPSSPVGSFFVESNYLDGNNEVTLDNKKGVKTKYPDSVFVDRPFDVEAIPDESAEDAFAAVLQFAGASLKRDQVDARIIHEVRTGISSSGKNGNGIIDSQQDVGGWPSLNAAQSPTDNDHDGLPDNWELSRQLNPGDPSDACRKTIDKMYDNIEVYLNELVKDVVKIK